MAPGAAVFSATAGMLALVAGDGLPAAEAGVVWKTWLTSDITGVLVLVPALLVLATRPWRRPTARRALEAAGMLVALAAGFALALYKGSDTSYLVFPVLVWAGLRFRVPGATAMSLLAAVVSVAMAAHGHGPFGVADGLEALLHTQGFIAVSTLTALVLAIASDEREAALRQLSHRALHDPLTGLPNRVLLAERLEQATQRAARDGTTLGVLLIDLDEFKIVNDSFGHHTGDELLCQIAPRLRAAARPQDTVARFGGDEFVVLCEGLAGPWDALEAARRLAAAWAEPFRLGDDDVYVSGSTGIALAQRGRTEPGALLREADAAMYRAKARGRGQAELYDEAMRAARVRAAAAGGRPAPRARRGRDRRRVPADPRPAHRPAARRRGARPLGAPRARRDLAGDVHPRRGGERADRRPRPPRAAHRVPRARPLAPRAARGRGAVRVGQRLAAPDRPRRAARRRQGGAARVRACRPRRSRSS